MRAKYSKSTGGIYVVDVSKSIPDDALDIPDALYARFQSAEISRFDVVNGDVVEYVLPPPTNDELAASIRAVRDRKIADIAWRYERTARQERLGITPTDNISALDAYVQALADITLQATFPQSVEWPEVPV